MPEGDTIHRAAAGLREAFGTDPFTIVEVRPSGVVPSVARPEPGDRFAAVEARGKHLLLGFAGGTTIHVHLGMRGAWRVDAGRSRPRLPHERTGVAIATEAASAVCRSAPVVELLDDAAIRRHAVLRALGPDLCMRDIDLDAVLVRLARADPAAPIGAVLLDQRVAAGIGNVYRSEVLWACGIEPMTPLSAIDAEGRRTLYARAAELLQANLTARGPRRTVPEGLAVYERAARPCRRCGTPIRTDPVGDPPRRAWWCPACQTRG